MRNQGKDRDVLSDGLNGEPDKRFAMASSPTKSKATETAVGQLRRRYEETRDWLEDNAPECFDEQRHLDDGSKERAYWHYGYMMALRDVLALFGSASTPKQ